MAWAWEDLEYMRYALCPADPMLPVRPTLDMADYTLGSVGISADRVKASEGRRSTFIGNVDLVKDQQAVSADLLSYHEESEVVEAHGRIRIWDPALFWTGEHGRLNLRSDETRLSAGSYQLMGRRGRGAAESIRVDSRNSRTFLQDVDYTTCDGEVPDWQINASEMEIDHTEEWGTAKHVFLELWDIPVLYVPYLSFPISEKRKSGFLPPTFGESSDTGADLAVPYYWNIAPEHDATLTPRVLSQRGVMLGGQYRYLIGNDGRGQADVEFLPVDSEFEDDSRSLFAFTHQQSFFGGRVGFYADYNRVSDDQYFEDLGNNLATSSTRFLPQHAVLSYGGRGWSVFGRVLAFQTVDPTVSGTLDPYERLPQVLFRTTTRERDRTINLSFFSEGTYFTRDSGPVGTRIDLGPTLSFPLYSPATFLVPRLTVRHTHYFLADTDGPNSPNRTLPIVSLDSGALFERDLSFFDTPFLQTLEPRIFYLYIPDSEQDDIPIFDTGRYDISFARLFREDRFTGADRIGDANQVTLALTSRVIDDGTGTERARARIGQIYYFDKRDVDLPNTPESDDPYSEIVGELGARVADGLSARAEAIWNPNDTSLNKGSVGLRYWPDPLTIVNAEYRVRRDIRGLGRTDVDQSDISFRLPVTPNWSVLGRWNFSFDTEETLEAVGGVEYDSCCWGVRAVSRRFLSTASGEFDNAFYIQLELKGLAGIGRNAGSFVKRSIPGYEYDF
ncbi:MAG: LPS-assembly protein LptD [Gammaproteobacteria bacterium]